MAAKRGYVLAGHRRMAHALRGLVAHPADDRNARMSEDHQRVVYVAHHARELELEDGVQLGDDFLGVDLIVFAGHGVPPGLSVADEITRRRWLTLQCSLQWACLGRSAQAIGRFRDAQLLSFRAGNVVPLPRAP